MIRDMYELKPIDDVVISKVRDYRLENDYYPTINELMGEMNQSKKVIIRSLDRLKFHGKLFIMDIRNRDSIVIAG